MSKDEKEGGLMYQQLRKFISVIDELRDVGLQQHIKLPRIAMLGGQSAGKSSVLESIVGLDFLPRGDGVVTRRPLELRLNHASENIQPWAKFEEVPNKQFTDFSEVKSTIEFLTDKICGTSKNIVDKPIVLSVYSHTCPDLTLVDLPGITRIPMTGSDQPDNIEQITRAMANRYVSDSRTIILCVLPANADMTTSDGLQMARQVDPKGIRTIGVVTKIDIMDKGTNAKRMIEGKDVQLRLGFIGIKNRSQQDIIDRIPVKLAIEREMLYFSTHPIYSTMPQGQLGIGNLTSKLSKILFTHIKHSLPEIAKEIKGKIKETEDEVSDLGTPMPSDPAHKQQLLWHMINDFVATYKNTISGQYDNKRTLNNQASKGSGGIELSGGAKIKNNFYKLYQEFDGFRATTEYDDMYIQRAIQMHEGDGLPGFPSVDVFIYLITPQLEKLRDPALELLQDTYSQLEQICFQIVSKIFQRFPTMIPEMMEIIIKALQKERDHARDVIEAIIDSEQNYLFTNDIGYKESRQDIIGQPAQGGDPNGQRQMPQKSSNIFVNDIRSRIDAYFDLVLRSVRDSVPKTIGCFLVRKSQEVIQFELYNQVNNNQKLSSSLGEPATITERRKTLTDILNTLKNSLRVLQRDPDISANTLGDDELELALKQEAMAQRQGGQPGGQPGGPRPMAPPPGGDMMRQQSMANSAGPGDRRMPPPGMGGPGGPMRGPPPQGVNPLGGRGAPPGQPGPPGNLFPPQNK